MACVECGGDDCDGGCYDPFFDDSDDVDEGPYTCYECEGELCAYCGDCHQFDCTASRDRDKFCDGWVDKDLRLTEGL